MKPETIDTNVLAGEQSVPYIPIPEGRGFTAQ
jgi:hypothetical protein